MSLQSNYLKESTENQVNEFKHIRHIRQATVCFEKQSFFGTKLHYSKLSSNTAKNNLDDRGNKHTQHSFSRAH